LLARFKKFFSCSGGILCVLASYKQKPAYFRRNKSFGTVKIKGTYEAKS
jgi:hypothetical protein